MGIFCRVMAWMFIAGLAVFCARAELQDFETSQVFVIDVAGSGFSNNFANTLQSSVSGTVLSAFGQVFGSYSLVGDTNSTNATRTHRFLFGSCPKNCHGANQVVCVALKCVTKSSGRGRKLSAGSCFAFDPSQAAEAMNKALVPIENECSISLNANLQTLQAYLANTM